MRLISTSKKKHRRNNSRQISRQEQERPIPLLESRSKRIGRGFLKVLSVFFALLFVTVVTLLTLIWVAVRGPSTTVQHLFVLTVKETSAIGFLADIFLTGHEVESILNYSEFDGDFTDVTDPSLIKLPTTAGTRPTPNRSAH